MNETKSTRAARLGRPPKSDAGEVEATLMRAARSVFLEHGYVGARMNEIVTRARASKRTVYERYSSKAALFEATVAAHIDEKFAGAEARLTPGGSVREQLLTLGRGYAEAAVDPDSQALDRIVMAEAATFPALAGRLHDMGFERATTTVAGLLSAVGARSPRLGADAFYSLLVLTPLRTHPIEARSQQPDVEEVVDFVLAGAGVRVAGRG